MSAEQIAWIVVAVEVDSPASVVGEPTARYPPAEIRLQREPGECTGGRFLAVGGLLQARSCSTSAGSGAIIERNAHSFQDRR